MDYDAVKSLEYQLDFLDWQPNGDAIHEKINEVTTVRTDSSGELIAITVH